MSKPIMNAEQFEAIEHMIAAAVVYGRVAPDRAHETIRQMATDACNNARRLLVEPEQAKPEYDGPCVGGPLDGVGMGADEDVVKRPGGEYQWSESQGLWMWFHTQPTDPDLTTFGTIPRGQRCQALDDDPVLAGKVFRRAYDGLLRHGRNAVEEETGKLWSIGDDEPVRRLPQ